MLFRPIRKPQPGNSAIHPPTPVVRPDRLVEWMESPRLGAFILRWLSHRPLLPLFRGLMVVYVFMVVVLPSGSILGVNVKVPCFLLLLSLAVQVSFARGQMTVARLVKLLTVPAILLLWAFLSQLYGFDASLALAQYRDIMITISTCWYASVLCDRDQGETLFLLRWIIYAEICASSLKIMMLLYALARGIPVSVMLDWIRIIFGVQLMGYDFESAFGRFEFISDNVIPVCIFALLCYRNLLSKRVGRTLLMLLVLVVSALFSFSRFLWAHTVMALILGLLLGKKDRFQAILVAILTGLTAVSLPFLIVVISLRFSAAVVGESNADRVTQVAALQNFIADAPWFGHGLGSYTHRVLRNLDAPFVYEAQLLALFGQVGIVGVILLVLLMMSYFRWFWPNEQHSGMRSVGLFLLLLGWLAGGFLNPSVISSAASVSYVAIFAMSTLHERTKLPNELLT
jgi:O-antigen ligase